MQNVGGKPSVLAANAGVKQTHDKIGIFQSPTGVCRVKPVDTIKVGARDGEIARLRTLPRFLPQPAQRPERKTQRRQQAIDAAAQSLGR
jgi:hypothetical protein